MSSITIDAKTLSKMFLTGAKSLEAKKAWINELNVFPVPDGDTGTNMTLTIMSSARNHWNGNSHFRKTAVCQKGWLLNRKKS